MAEQAVILAGGKGTRLGALTERTPKPLLDVAGRPFIEYLIWNLSQAGIKKLVLSTGHLAEQFNALGARDDFPDVTLHQLEEAEPLGTGGALAHLASMLDERFYVLNGDSLFDVDFSGMIDIFGANPDAAGVLALRHVADASRYGRVETEGPYVRRFAEKTPATSPGWVNGGVYLFNRAIVSELPDGPSSLETDLFPRLAEEGRLLGTRQEGFFIDIGIPADYSRAQVDVPAWYREKRGQH